MRLALGGFSQETNCLAAQPATLQSFRDSRLVEGEAVLAGGAGTATELGGALAAAADLAVELAPTLSARAVSSAPVTREAFEWVAGRLLEGIRSAGHLDAVVLLLHGATVVEGYDDGVGELLRRVRGLVGPRVPITGTLDLHANLTRPMVAASDALVVYHTYPHVDLFRVGDLATRLAVRAARGEVRPVSALRRLPMIVPPDNSGTSSGPAAELREHVEEIERRPGVLSASFCPTQPWLNVPDLACSALVVADGDRAVAERGADELAAHFWALRARFYEFESTPVAEAVRQALAAPRGPVVLADGADATGSGSSGDSTAILRALLDAGAAAPVYLSIVDSEAVAECVRAGVGATLALSVGARIDRRRYAPCEVTGRVRLISDGDFHFKGPQATGSRHSRGRTVVLAVGAIQVVLSERAAFNWDPEFYRSLGLEPGDAQIVVVKSPTAYRAAYAGLLAEAIQVDGPGASTSNIRSLAGELDRVPRPIYPLDEVADWEWRA